MPPSARTAPHRAKGFTRRLFRTLVPALAACAALAVRALGAQDVERPGPWTGSARANASVFFGNAEQRVLGARAALGRADSTVEVRGDLQTLYGDASVDGAPRRVTKRVWLGTLAADYRPLDRVSPFAFGTAETNLEKRISARYSAGAGAKWTFVRSERTESSLSLALMDERTVPRDSTVRLPTERVTRWSWRARVRHAVDERTRVSHVTFWRPSTARAGDFLVLSTTELDYAITRAVRLSLSFLDNYDSEAVRRGARAYNDGQLLFGIEAEW